MFDLSLLIQTLTRSAPLPQDAAEPGATPDARDRLKRARSGERLFSDALSGLGQPLNAG
ncbi:hypothetical protein [Aureimonas pseudogalii]|uniref:Uncharacterized protein n=1 Tax=Aureimonas pseudogalii TaxID=1744844 RepID=A0A7W6EE52_9HYPH|nr:hypothetical protein [Aureimonas pseudogalii]MBB3996990.1 hypothetical protein [Aureimonas pseudogalii]